MRWSAADVRGTAASIAPWWALLTAASADLRPPPELLPFLCDDRPTNSGTAATTQAAVEAALSALSRVGRDLADRGRGMTPQSGAVTGLYVSDGGVPKQPVAEVAVSTTGVEGDRQRTRRHHGRIWQALCLWSSEVIGELQAEGHPVFAGACGENIVISGIEWGALQPGTRLRIGSVLAEVSLPAVPCKQIRPYFTGAKVSRINHGRHPGSSRWYATVVEPGLITAGAAVEVEPDGY